MDYDVRHIRVVDPSTLAEQLRTLFHSQTLAVLSTHERGQPYCSLIAFASTEDLKHLVFATTRSTRKYANIEEDSRVSMLIDNRSNKISDFHDAMAVTATGRAAEVLDEEKDSYLSLYLNKHPHLEDFVLSPTCALVRMQIDKYVIVSRFQHVMMLHMKS